jgi:HSP20 family protein
MMLGLRAGGLGRLRQPHPRPRGEVRVVELKIWTPLLDLEKELRSLFDRFPHPLGSELDFRPTTDVVREDGTLVVTTEVPGIDPENDIEITLDDDMLVIKGHKTAEKEVSEKDSYLLERHFGSFERRVPLPDGVDPDAITASYDKGVLTVRVPIPPEAVESIPRAIPIKVG